MIFILIPEKDIIINQGIIYFEVKLGLFRKFMHYWSWIWIGGTIIISTSIFFFLYIISFYFFLSFNKTE